jgi:hypothetical protein
MTVRETLSDTASSDAAGAFVAFVEEDDRQSTNPCGQRAVDPVIAIDHQGCLRVRDWYRE